MTNPGRDAIPPPTTNPAAAASAAAANGLLRIAVSTSFVPVRLIYFWAVFLIALSVFFAASAPKLLDSAVLFAFGLRNHSVLALGGGIFCSSSQQVECHPEKKPILSNPSRLQKRLKRHAMENTRDEIGVLKLAGAKGTPRSIQLLAVRKTKY
jgi:hypothetical protein